LVRTGVSPRAIKYAWKPDTDDNRRAIVRADRPDSRSTMAHHPPIAALMGEELEHIRRLHRSRVLADDSEERLQVERDRPQGVGPRPTRHELQIPIQQRMAERVAHLTRRRDGANQARMKLIAADSQRPMRCTRINMDHPCIRRSVPLRLRAPTRAEWAGPAETGNVGPSLTVIPLHDDKRALPPGTGRLARCRELLARHGVESRVALSFGAEQLPIGLRTVIGHRLV
jgi:hypothetical protein